MAFGGEDGGDTLLAQVVAHRAPFEYLEVGDRCAVDSPSILLC